MAQTYAYQHIERRLVNDIGSGALLPGEKLPSLRSMSTRHGVSLNTVLKAYEELERQGVIESRPRSGFYVCQSQVLPAPKAPDPLAAEELRPENVSRCDLIRQVLSTMGSSGLLALGLSLPHPSLLPDKALGRLLAAAAREHGHRALDYAPVQGIPELRKAVAPLAQQAGADLGPDDIIITSGAVEALSIALRATTRPGDAVAIPTPTYYCLLELMETLGLRAIEVPSCPAEGLDPADLAKVLSRFDVAAIVLIPNFNNPDGSLMPDDIKAEVVRLAGDAGVPIIEDDVYGDLSFAGHRPSLLQSFAPRHGKAEVLTCSSFAKTVSPGFRVGWLAPGRRMETAFKLKLTTNVCAPTLPQFAMAEFIRRGSYARQVDMLRSAVKRQAWTLRAAIARHFPAETAVTDPAGGMQLWMKLPGKADAVRYFLEAQRKGIAVCPGVIFSPSDRFGDYVRISCGTVWSDEMEQGMKTLGELARDLA